MRTHHELERTFAPDRRTPLPDLTVIPGVEAMVETGTVDLEATYLDTEALDLVRGGVSLRRRTGGGDEGWHLKVPAGEGRDEIHARLGSGTTVPAALRRLVQGRTGRRELVEIAVVRTRRRTLDLLDDDGARLAEVADDEVTAQASGGPEVRWHEWEIELVDGDPALLDAAAEVLAEEGVAEAEVGRKIERVLGDRLETTPPADAKRGKPAGRVLRRRLADQLEALRRADVDVRRGRHEGVHQVRVASRRLRSALATYRPLVDREVTEPVRDELRWLGRELGAARDAAVADELLRDLVAAEPRALVHGPVRQRIRGTFTPAARQGLRHAQEVLGSARYLRLVERLDALATDPPLTEKAEKRADRVLPKRLHKDVRRLEDRLDAVASAEAQGDDHARDEAWHDARKAAKRLRYAAETLRPAFGKDAKRAAKAAKALTTVLGERQDTEVVRAELPRLARAAEDAGEPSFTYGLLHARQAEADHRLAARAWRTWHERRGDLAL